MDNRNSKEITGNDLIKVASVFFFILLVVFFILLSLRSPRPVAETAPAEEFSSGRALKHLEIIARQPHAWETEANAEVRDYISGELIKLGIDTVIQEKTFPYFDRNRIHHKKVFNVIARIKGLQNSKAVLLIAHYDSAGESPGASDGGAGVVALMEAARAVQSGPKLKNDIVLLFSDGHEPGMFGAKAFVKEYSGLEGIGPAFQFGARGSGGTVALAFIGGGNGWMIKNLKKAVPYILSTSLSSGVFNLLPYYSDLMILDGEGFMGAHYAYGGDYFTYHNRLDTVGRLSEKNVQNHGRIALDIARFFGNLDIGETRGNELVFFNLPGIPMVHYPVSWTKPLLLVVLVFFIFVLFAGFKRRFFRASRLGLGFLSFLITVLAVIGSVIFLWFVFTKIYPDKEWMLQYKYRVFLAGFAALAVLVFSSFYVLFRKILSILEFAAAGAFPWLLFAILSGLFAPAVSYIFIWPLLFCLISLILVIFMKDPQVSLLKSEIICALCALPGFIIVTPLVILFYQALQMSQFSAALIMILIVFLLFLLVPIFAVMEYPRRGWLPVLSLLTAVFFFTAGIIGSRDYGDYPQIESSSISSRLAGRLARRIKRRFSPPPVSEVSPLDQIVGCWRRDDGLRFEFGTPEMFYNDFAGSFVRTLPDGSVSNNVYAYRGEDRISGSLTAEIFWEQGVPNSNLTRVRFFIGQDGQTVRIVPIGPDDTGTADGWLLRRVNSPHHKD